MNRYNSILFPSEHMGKYEEFMNQYGDKSEKYILEEISSVKNNVSQEVIQKYVRNLELFSQMEGFITNEQSRRIDMIKRMLTENTSMSNSQAMQQSIPTSQSFATSLLLWFLILVAIWPRPYPPYKPHQPHRPYPPRRPYPPYRPPYPPYRPFPFF